MWNHTQSEKQNYQIERSWGKITESIETVFIWRILACIYNVAVSGSPFVFILASEIWFLVYRSHVCFQRRTKTQNIKLLYGVLTSFRSLHLWFSYVFNSTPRKIFFSISHRNRFPAHFLLLLHHLVQFCSTPSFVPLRSLPFPCLYLCNLIRFSKSFRQYNLVSLNEK